MKKIFLPIIICIFTTNYAFASSSEIKNIIESIKNAPDGSLTAYDIPTTDDCVHTVIQKNNTKFLYKRACFPISLRFAGADPIKDADYKFTVYGDQEINLIGNYEQFKDLIAVLPSPKGYEPAPTVSKPKSIFGKSCDPYGFNITSENDQNIIVEYDYGFTQKDFNFPKIFDDNGVKVYFGGDNDIFVKTNNKWQNYGHYCTKMESKSFIHECSPENKIKIVWYKYERDPHMLVDIVADTDSLGLSDLILVYKQHCKSKNNCKKVNKNPIVFLRQSYDSLNFKHDDMLIKYQYNNTWLTDNKLCVQEDTQIKKISTNIPDVLKEPAESWEKMGFGIEYVGKYPDTDDDYSGADIYKTIPKEKNSRTGFPTVYAIRNNTIIKEVSGHEAMTITSNTWK